VRVAVRASVLLVVASFAASSASAQPLITAIVGVDDLGNSSSITRLRAAGVQAVRINLSWADVAPASRSADFDAADPADPAYSWSSFDRQVTSAVAAGVDPIVDIIGAPVWAEKAKPQPYYGAIKPDASELALFARAAARRYGGGFEGLPRVHNWMLWNEPNLIFWLQPQFEHGRPYSPGLYRGMLNAFADAIHGVHADNVVIAGATAPFTSADGTTAKWGVAPLAFLRTLLCLGRNLRPACSARAKFDVWAHHPYTSGGPTHHANFPDDVSLGDLPKMKAVLDAGVRARKIVSRHHVRFWVTEFSWDTSPPDPEAVPIALQARWVSEAMYTMWRNGVSLVTWFTLVDSPFPDSAYQSGLYFVDGKPKPTLTAFRFPFVALHERSQLRLWGRTPLGTAGRVSVEKRDGAWRRFAVVRADRYGIFNVRRPFASGIYRVRFAGETSLGFSTTEPPDRFYRPFGTVQ
jgi:hypothetical protein